MGDIMAILSKTEKSNAYCRAVLPARPKPQKAAYSVLLGTGKQTDSLRRVNQPAKRTCLRAENFTTFVADRNSLPGYRGIRS